MMPVGVREYCGGGPAAVMLRMGVKLWFSPKFLPPSLSLFLNLSPFPFFLFLFSLSTNSSETEKPLKKQSVDFRLQDCTCCSVVILVSFQTHPRQFNTFNHRD